MLEEHYIRYHTGHSPIVLIAAHGGYWKPKEIKNRRYGNTNQDIQTQELAIMMRDFLSLTLRLNAPHLIINLLHRIKLDANRDIKEGAQGSKEAEAAWKQFHTYIDTAKEAALSQHGFCFLIDIHGFPSTVKKIYLGYNLTGANLKKSDKKLDREKYINKCSLKRIYETQDFNFTSLIRGQDSFANFFYDEDISNKYKVIPSPKMPDNGQTKFYGSGYNTKKHCTNISGDLNINGFQLEISKEIRQDEKTLKHFNKVFCNSLVKFIEHVFKRED